MTTSVLAPSVDYQLETVASIRASGIEELFERHRLELSHYPDLALDVDWARYESCEAGGVLRVMTARKAGRIIGYVAFFVAPNAHYKGSLQAIQDVLYLDADYRHGRTGYRLIALAEDYLRREGIQVLYQHCKVTHPLGSLFLRTGYQLIDFVYGKRLDWPDGVAP